MEWLADGLAGADKNLLKFAEINELLAFKPWVVNDKIIEKLLEKDENGFSWNVEQVLNAGTILATFHGLCSFVQG